MLERRRTVLVLIPLNSGLAWSNSNKRTINAYFVLIPLNSGLAWSTKPQSRGFTHVLIPLNSGLAWSLRQSQTLAWGAGLNPFEFRAGLKQDSVDDIISNYVLIPLNSGLAWSKDFHPWTNGYVLIPLNSGLAWSPRSWQALRGSVSLNPFEFRADLKPKDYYVCKKDLES